MALRILPRTDAPPPATASRLRAKLAERISQRDVAQRAIAQLEAAREPAWRGVLEAEACLPAAREALAQAQSDAVTARIAELAGDRVPAFPTVAEARAALRRAEDNLVSASEVRAEIERRFEAARSAVPTVEGYLADAANAVLTAETTEAAAKLGSELACLQSEICRKGLALRFLMGLTHPVGAAVSAKTRTALNRLSTPPAYWDEINLSAEGGSLMAEWRDVLTALQTDATAPVPIL